MGERICRPKPWAVPGDFVGSCRVLCDRDITVELWAVGSGNQGPQVRAAACAGVRAAAAAPGEGPG